MRTQIRRVGNSAGVVIPAVMLKEANVEVGTRIELTVVDGVFVAKPIIETRRRVARSTLTLDSLIANYVRFEDEVFSKPTDREVIHDDSATEQRQRWET